MSLHSIGTGYHGLHSGGVIAFALLEDVFGRSPTSLGVPCRPADTFLFYEPLLTYSCIRDCT